GIDDQQVLYLTGRAYWRLYDNCTPDSRRACDVFTDSAIIDGGNALIAFTHVTGNTLHGRILATSDPRTIPIASPAQLVLERYGMGLLVLGTESMDLCGPHYLEEAPPEFQQTFPCGA